MANWVYNTINGYTKDLYEKYKGEEEAIDFEKVIPIPDDVKHTLSSTINEKAESAVKFREFSKSVHEEEEDFVPYRFASIDNPILENVNAYASYAYENIGKRCAANPDKSINQLKEEDDYVAYNYEKIKAIFGDDVLMNHPDYERISENYIGVLEKDFSEFKNHYPESFYPNESIYDYGNRIMDIKEKYGVSDCFQYTLKNYGVNSNAIRSEYDPESEQLKFETKWDIPYPVIAKIANDNPSANLEGYSEEETGWNREYVTKDGKLSVIAKGQITYKEQSDPTESPIIHERTVIENPVYKTYDQIMKENISEINSAMKPFGSTIM